MTAPLTPSREIERLWRQGLDTYEIALRLRMTEAHVYSFVNAMVGARAAREREVARPWR